MMWLAANRVAWNEKLFRDTGSFDRYGAPGTITMQQRKIKHNELTIKLLTAYNPRRKAKKTSIYARQKLISFNPYTDCHEEMMWLAETLNSCRRNMNNLKKEYHVVLFDLCDCIGMEPKALCLTFAFCQHNSKQMCLEKEQENKERNILKYEDLAESVRRPETGISERCSIGISLNGTVAIALACGIDPKALWHLHSVSTIVSKWFGLAY
ncbi:hypothetical protein T10_8361 [Trichinella papuae]|uniref:Uncharacterized protein n=1 Tax=Trichinella papuae TaxID=268474 RepID=A0A0V1MZQ4_9BILA|nr:hypothetical protein T10_8361 [Trichinella papuae]